MNKYENICRNCHFPYPDKGRALDGRRAYRCSNYGTEWTNGLQGGERKYSHQRNGNQFADSGASRK